MKALITGFDPFGGERINPAFEIVKALPKTIAGCDIVIKEIPTVFNKSLRILEETMIQENPDIVLCIGQAGGEYTIRIERVGLNLDEARIPDNEGNCPSDQPIRDDGKMAYFSTLPTKAILKEMKDNMIPAHLSYSAGTYVCNHLLYGLMYLIDTKFTTTRGGFIHVPYLPEQVIDKKNTPFMDIVTMTKAIELAIKVSVETDIDIEYRAGTLN